MNIEAIESKEAPKAIGPYSQAIRAGGFLFISGQLAIDLKTGRIEEESIEGQTRVVLSHLHAILAEAGLTFASVVKVEVFMKDLNDFQKMNRLYSEAFSHPIKPARQAFQVARLPLDALIEISCIAQEPIH